MTKFILVTFILFSFISLADINSVQIPPAQSIAALAQLTNTNDADLELAQRYVPVLYFHPDEIYHPQPVDVVLGISRLRQSRQMWFDTTILNYSTMQDLFAKPSDETWFLDQWLGDTGSSEYANYSTHQAIYKSSFSPHVGGPEPVTYAHVVRDENPEYITIQFWLFYFYQDWFNKHEGDWEMVEVTLTANGQPEWVVYSQHHGGARRSWESTPIEAVTHPVAYVARNSHANYFVGNEVYPYGQDIGNRQLVLVDRTGISGRLLPEVILIPTRAELAADPSSWPGAEWLMFRGRWGETAIYGDFNGPYGPADKGFQWEEPFTWGISQPLDIEIWFKNRLQVEITGPAQVQARIWLTDESERLLSLAESIDNLAILHSEPPEKVLAQVDGTPGTIGDVTISWPDRASETVTQTRFSSFKLDTSGHAQLELSAGQVIFLSASNQLALQPSLIETYTTIWDAPDSVLVGNNLPIHEIIGGLIISLFYSLVPILVLVAILYWIDRYQREPVRMLAVAFLWGAIPALVIALSLQLFFRLPPNVLGPNALEAIRLGLLAPVLEETLKAAGVLFIYWRRRREINDVLDGMIYGAVVGFGFAFISNFFRYAGNFIAWGNPGLNSGLIAERTVNALDHGLYTAIFGAGLGFASMAKSRQQFWAWVMAALGVAIATHTLHNLLANSLVGLNVFTVIVTSAGTLVLWTVAGWSLVKQRQLLRKELQGLVHDSLYYSVQGPLVRAKTQWNALRWEGFRAWIQERRLQGLCIKLANTRLQARLFPENHKHSDKAFALQAEIKRVFDEIRQVTR